MAREYLRQVAITALTGRTWTLRTWETSHEQDRYRGMFPTRYYLGYELIDPDGVVLFSGEDFGCSCMDSIDSDATLRGILGFLTCRPHDTDAEYFESYTPDQREFSESYECESMACYADDEFSEPFTDLD